MTRTLRRWLLAAMFVGTAHAETGLLRNGPVVVDLEVAAPTVGVEVAEARTIIAERYDTIEKCLALAKKIPTESGFAVVTVDGKGAIRRVDTTGLGATTTACVRKLVGATHASAVAGAYAVKVDVKPFVTPFHTGTARVELLLDASAAPGGRTAAEINRALKVRAGLVKACYQKELAKEPKLGAGGKLVVAFTIGTDGAVTESAIAQAFHAAVDACVIAQIRRLRFPAGNPAKVRYPFVFSG
ncbi:MAG: AgmX/PglI C-terminal domain-containing protein [Kofleriaceae bacterium]|nr:AgmX/PglI C-terminal domain-containing protein [Kofleriaceae bacterium]